MKWEAKQRELYVTSQARLHLPPPLQHARALPSLANHEKSFSCGESGVRGGVESMPKPRAANCTGVAETSVLATLIGAHSFSKDRHLPRRAEELICD